MASETMSTAARGVLDTLSIRLEFNTLRPTATEERADQTMRKLGSSRRYWQTLTVRGADCWFSTLASLH